MGISSQGQEGRSGLQNLRDLIIHTRLEYQKSIPGFQKWPCPFCFNKNQLNQFLNMKIQMPRQFLSTRFVAQNANSLQKI